MDGTVAGLLIGGDVGRGVLLIRGPVGGAIGLIEEDRLGVAALVDDAGSGASLADGAATESGSVLRSDSGPRLFWLPLLPHVKSFYHLLGEGDQGLVVGFWQLRL